MEPERKIEKLLRAYAKKRRARAGDSLKLHPMMRRRLHEEVARNVSQPDESNASMSLWELFRQRWAFLLSFALMIFFGAALFLPTLGSAKKKAQILATLNNLRQIGTAAQIVAGENSGKLPVSLDALTNQLASDKILIDAESGQRFIYIAGGENLEAMQSNSMLAYAPTDKKGRAVLFADGRAEIVNGAQFSELTNQQWPGLAFAKDSTRRIADTSATMTVASGNGAAMSSISGQLKPADEGAATPNAGDSAANLPAAPPPRVDRLDQAPGATGNYSVTQTKSGQFASAGSQNSIVALQNNFKNIITSAKTASVLANFQVQQNGNAIRIVDADGSVYDGSLQPESAVAASRSPPGTSAAPVTVLAQADQKKAAVGLEEEAQAAQNYFFRVSGMNQTLKQSVVFSGNLLAYVNAARNPPQSFGRSVGGQLQPVFTNQLPWRSSRIAGTAVISDTNHIEINATPQAP